METVTIETAGTQFLELIARVEAGDEIVLTRGEHPIAKLVPFGPVRGKSVFGAMHGVISLGDAFFEPLPKEELAAWG